jgi:hypothetical protein
MTRKTTQWPNINRGDYDRWRNVFYGGPLVRAVLAKVSPEEAELMVTLLFAAQVGPRQLTKDQTSATWPKLNVATRISLTDYVITFLVARLKGKTRSVNEDIAALLNAAGVPAAKPAEGWAAEAIKKRRARMTHDLWVSQWGPRLMLRLRFLRLLTARESDASPLSATTPAGTPKKEQNCP